MSDDVHKTRKEAPSGTVKTRVSMAMKVIRRDGTVEDHGEQASRTVEIDYDQAVNFFGKEKADELFKGVEGSE